MTDLVQRLEARIASEQAALDLVLERYKPQNVETVLKSEIDDKRALIAELHEALSTFTRGELSGIQRAAKVARDRSAECKARSVELMAYAARRAASIVAGSARVSEDIAAAILALAPTVGSATIQRAAKVDALIAEAIKRAPRVAMEYDPSIADVIALCHALEAKERECERMRAALKNIADGMYSSALMSDEALQSAVASIEGRSAWKEKCISELQAIARAALQQEE